MNTIIVVPCFNEARRLSTDVFREYLQEHPAVSFLFVDDGSTDGTPAMLEQLATESTSVRILRLPRNAGKAEAVRAGMRAAAGMDAFAVGYWDADLAAPLSAIQRLLAILQEHPEVRLAMGSRVALLGHDIRRSAARHYGGRVIATAAAGAIGLAVYDTQCGAKLFRAGPVTHSLFERPFLSRWMFDVEVIARIIATGGGQPPSSLIREVPLAAWHDVSGSKVRLRDGLAALYELARIHLAYRRPPGVTGSEP